MINYRKGLIAATMLPLLWGVDATVSVSEAKTVTSARASVSSSASRASSSSAARSSSFRSSTMRATTRSAMRSERYTARPLASSNTSSSVVAGAATGAVVGGLAVSGMSEAAEIIDDVSDVAEAYLASVGDVDNVGSVASVGDVDNVGSVDNVGYLVGMSEDELFRLAQREHQLMSFVKHGFVVCGVGIDTARSTGCEVDVQEGFGYKGEKFTWEDYVERVTGISDANITGLAYDPDNRRVVVYFSYISK